MTWPPPNIDWYWADEQAAIACGDCLEILPKLPAGCVDLVLTDPPYGVGHPTDYYARGRGKIARCKNYPPVHGDDKPFDPKPILSLDIPSVLWGANHYASRLPDASGWLVWDKQRPPDLDQATCELAWTNFIKGVRIFHFLWNGALRASKEALAHPTQKPTALLIWCLDLRWTPNGTVLDPFMGSGTTLVAAKELGRRAIGIEIEEKYCRIAVERLQQGVLPLEVAE